MPLTAAQQKKILEIQRRKGTDPSVLTSAQLRKIQDIERSRGLTQDPQEVFGPILPQAIAEEREIERQIERPEVREGPLTEEERLTISEVAPSPVERLIQPDSRDIAFGENIARLRRQAREEPSAIREFARELPTVVARTVAQPFEFLRDVSATLGQKLQPFVPEALKIDPQSDLGQVLGVLTPAGAEEIRFPGVKKPLLKKVDTIDSAREAAGEGLEAAGNVLLALSPVKPGILKSAAQAGRAGFILGTGEALQDENIDSASQVLGRGVLSAAVTASLPLLPKAIKKLGQKSVQGVFNSLNRFTNKSTGEALKTIRATPPEIIRKFGTATDPFPLRKRTFAPLYKEALDEAKGTISKKEVRNAVKAFIDVEPEGKLGKFAKQLENTESWTFRKLHDLTNKMRGPIPKNPGAWTHEQSLANDALKSIRDLIAKKSPQYKAVNKQYGEVTRFLKADKLINESGSGVVGLGFSALLGNTFAGPLGAVVVATAKSAKAQRAVIEGLKKIEGARSAQAAKSILDSFAARLPDKESRDAVARLAILLAIREQN